MDLCTDSKPPKHEININYLGKQSGFSTAAMVERLEPRAEKKLPRMSISLGFKLLAIATEKRPATATSSHPDRLLKKQENS